MVDEKNNELAENNEVQNEEVDNLDVHEDELEPPQLDAPDGLPEKHDQSKGVHPLTPGGRRFEQVYAESKQAKRDLAKERELRIAAEAKLAVLENKPSGQTPDADIEYTWPQLEEFIQQGRITRADAEAHREAVLTKHVAKKLKTDLTIENSEASRSQALQLNIQKYVDAVPNILVEHSEERERLDVEFDFLASVQGLDAAKMTDNQRKALQLTALRTVYGPIDSLSKRTEKPKGEMHQGLPGGIRPSGNKNPDQVILDSLTKREVAHYQKMMRNGRYPNGWKDVVEELKFDPKAKRASR